MSASQWSLSAGGKSRPPPHPARILLADDEEPVARDLVAGGYMVLGPTRTARETVELSRQAQPDLAVVDIDLLAADGLEAAEAALKHLPVPVVVLAASAGPAPLSARCGALGYLVKPVSAEQLRASMTVAWAQFCQVVQLQRDIADLRQRLENRRIIEQAKWIIVRRKEISEPDAMKLLQRQSRNHRRPLVEVSRSIVENESLFAE